MKPVKVPKLKKPYPAQMAELNKNLRQAFMGRTPAEKRRLADTALLADYDKKTLYYLMDLRNALLEAEKKHAGYAEAAAEIKKSNITHNDNFQYYAKMIRFVEETRMPPKDRNKTVNTILEANFNEIEKFLVLVLKKHERTALRQGD